MPAASSAHVGGDFSESFILGFYFATEPSLTVESILLSIHTNLCLGAFSCLTPSCPQEENQKLTEG